MHFDAMMPGLVPAAPRQRPLDRMAARCRQYPIEPIPHQDKFGATGKANAAEVRTSQGEKQ
jgi:hypothetical protein